jgi:acyl dehydratase
VAAVRGDDAALDGATFSDRRLTNKRNGRTMTEPLALDGELYLEDFAVGQRYRSGRVTLDLERLKSFAAEFDPQPFHLDEEAAAKSLFRGLAASGWHTAALTMTLLAGSELRPAGGIIGAGAEELRWPRPTRPGDVLGCVSEVLETRPSVKRPEQGLVKLRVTTSNAADEAVFVLVINIIVPARLAAT